MARELDRETTDSYRLSILATHRCAGSFSRFCAYVLLTTVYTEYCNYIDIRVNMHRSNVRKSLKVRPDKSEQELINFHISAGF